MKKIRITLITAGIQRFPGCADILGDWPEFRLVYRTSSLLDEGLHAAFAGSDVLLVDQAVLVHEGAELIRSVCEAFPLLKVLLILDEQDDELVVEAIASGVDGVMERDSMRALLRRAVPALYAGESWISRDLAHVVRRQLRHETGSSSGNGRYVPPFRPEKLN